MNAILKEKSKTVRIEDGFLMCQLFYFLTTLKEIIVGSFLCSVFWKQKSPAAKTGKILFDYLVANIKDMSESNSHCS